MPTPILIPGHSVVLTNVESGPADADFDIVAAYAGLCEDTALRVRLLAAVRRTA